MKTLSETLCDIFSMKEVENHQEFPARISVFAYSKCVTTKVATCVHYMCGACKKPVWLCIR